MGARAAEGAVVGPGVVVGESSWHSLHLQA